MLRVHNKGVINKITKGFFATNRIRNIFAIISVILTTLMFITLFTTLMSMKKSIEESTMRQVGGMAHGSFRDITLEEFEKLKDNKLVKEMEYSIALFNGTNEALKKRVTEIKYATEKQSELNFAKPTTGTMPKAMNEIATDKIVLEALGIEPKIGNKVEIEYILNGEKQKDKFILSGYWEGDKVIPASQIWVSKEYTDFILKNLDKKEKEEFVGQLNGDILLKNSLNIERDMKRIILDAGYKVEDIEYGVNWAYLSTSNSIEPSLVISVVVLILLIGLCGYLIIYNIFFISISKDIKFYGLLKTIGTTSKQIKRIIRKQCLLIGVIGIPLGLILGFIVSKVITPLVLGEMNILSATISINPIIFIGAAIFSLVTILISVRKPAKVAGKVSPIEAIRTTDGKVNRNINFKTIKLNKVYSMAVGNIFRNMKKVILVVLSLSLSIVILNGTIVVTNSFDMNKYLSRNMVTDFIIGDSNYFNTYNGFENEDTLKEQVIKEISNLKAVKDVGEIKFIEVENNINNEFKKKLEGFLNKYGEGQSKEIKEIGLNEINRGILSSHIYSLDKMALNKLEIIEGALDYSKLSTGKYIIGSSYDGTKNTKYYNVGDKVTINSKEYEVMAVANIPERISIRHGHAITMDFFMGDKEFERNYKNIPTMITLIDSKVGYESVLEEEVKNYSTNINRNLSYESKELLREEFKSMESTFKWVGLALSIILAIIGVMNFINTMITSIVSRKNELGMLEGIGMTKKQITKLLIIEGLLYIVLTALVTLSLGIIISYIAIKAILSSMWFVTFKFTIIPIIMAIIILMIISVVVSIVISKILNKESIVNRLRDFE